MSGGTWGPTDALSQIRMNWKTLAIQSTAPSTASAITGQLWFNTSSNTLTVYYASINQWIPFATEYDFIVTQDASGNTIGIPTSPYANFSPTFSSDPTLAIGSVFSQIANTNGGDILIAGPFIYTCQSTNSWSNSTFGSFNYCFSVPSNTRVVVDKYATLTLANSLNTILFINSGTLALPSTWNDYLNKNIEFEIYGILDGNVANQSLNRNNSLIEIEYAQYVTLKVTGWLQNSAGKGASLKGCNSVKIPFINTYNNQFAGYELVGCHNVQMGEVNNLFNGLTYASSTADGSHWLGASWSGTLASDTPAGSTVLTLTNIPSGIQVGQIAAVGTVDMSSGQEVSAPQEYVQITQINSAQSQIKVQPIYPNAVGHSGQTNTGLTYQHNINEGIKGASVDISADTVLCVGNLGQGLNIIADYCRIGKLTSNYNYLEALRMSGRHLDFGSVYTKQNSASVRTYITNNSRSPAFIHFGSLTVDGCNQQGVDLSGACYSRIDLLECKNTNQTSSSVDDGITLGTLMNINTPLLSHHNTIKSVRVFDNQLVKTMGYAISDQGMFNHIEDGDFTGTGIGVFDPNSIARNNIYRNVSGANPFGVIATPFTNPYSIPAPTSVIVTASSTGGLLSNGTYYYIISAVDSLGNETIGSSEVSINVQSASSTGSVSLTWTSSAGANWYRVYRGSSSGAESQYWLISVPNYVDRGGASMATFQGKPNLPTLGPFGTTATIPLNTDILVTDDVEVDTFGGSVMTVKDGNGNIVGQYPTLAGYKLRKGWTINFGYGGQTLKVVGI